MTCLGVLDRGDRDKDNETGLKEGGVIKMSTTVLSIYAMHALHSLFDFYLPSPSGIAAKYPKTHVNDVNICGKRCVSKKID